MAALPSGEDLRIMGALWTLWVVAQVDRQLIAFRAFNNDAIGNFVVVGSSTRNGAIIGARYIFASYCPNAETRADLWLA
jgi:phytoene dehydrogenase-like protein